MRSFGVSVSLVLAFGTAVPVCPVLAAPARQPTSTLLVSVADADNHRFVENAQVRLPQLGRNLTTDWQGEVNFPDLKPGNYRIEVRALGYAPSNIELVVKGDTAGAFFELERVSSKLDTITLTQKRIGLHLEEFDVRRRMGIGRFISDSILESEGNHDLRVVLETRFPGIVHAPDGSNRIVSRRGTTYLPQARLNGMYRNIDGVDVYLDGYLWGGSLPTVIPSDLSGVELYPMGMAPPLYRRGSGASHVLLLWSAY